MTPFNENVIKGKIRRARRKARHSFRWDTCGYAHGARHRHLLTATACLNFPLVNVKSPIGQYWT